MVLKSAFLLAVSASLVLTTQAAPTMRDTPLYKRNSAEKEVNKALLDQKVADCVAKSIGLGEDKSSSKYVEQVLACKNIADAKSGPQDQAAVERLRDVTYGSAMTQKGSNSEYAKGPDQQVAPDSQGQAAVERLRDVTYGSAMTQEGPDSHYAKGPDQQVAPGSQGQAAVERLRDVTYGSAMTQEGSNSEYAKGPDQQVAPGSQYASP